MYVDETVNVSWSDLFMPKTDQTRPAAHFNSFKIKKGHWCLLLKQPFVEKICNDFKHVKTQENARYIDLCEQQHNYRVSTAGYSVVKCFVSHRSA